MTARDEAIEAMAYGVDQMVLAANPDTLPSSAEAVGALLDAIPADVLARLTIERGGLPDIKAVVDTSATACQLGQRIAQLFGKELKG